MPRNGTYRGVYSSLVDDLDFQRLSPEARLVFHTVRICSQIGPAGIFRYYLGPLSEQTGLSERKVEACLRELEVQKPGEEYGWILREGGVLWVINALRHDPTMRLSDKKHQKSVIRAISCLPRQDIVVKFCEYYGLPRPFEGPTHAPSKTMRKKSSAGSPSPSPSPKKTESESESEEEGSERVGTPGAADTPTHHDGGNGLDPELKKLLAECPYLALVSNGESSDFWDGVLGACEPYPVADGKWLGAKIRKWNQWFADHPERQSRKRQTLQSRLMRWLVRDLEELARRPW